MITFYYNPLSPNSRRVWLMLLEKNLTFEPLILKLNGDQFAPEFMAINPFHHVPVLIDDGVRLVESLAILDYLDAKYPEPSLIPRDANRLAQVRMVQFLAVNELMPSLLLHVYADEHSLQLSKSKQQLSLTFEFMEALLKESSFFGGEALSVADIVAGTVMPLLVRCGIDLHPYVCLNQWLDRIQVRPTWQATAVTDEGWYEFQRRIQVMARLRQRTRSTTKLKPVLAQTRKEGRSEWSQ